MNFRREWTVHRQLIRWSPENQAAIAEERLFVGPLREIHRGHYSGRLGASDWIGSLWQRRGTRQASPDRRRAGKRLGGEWRRRRG